jgi:hypothetical protein
MKAMVLNRFLLLIPSVLLFAGRAHGQAGFYVKDDMADGPNGCAGLSEVTNKTLCFDASEGILKLWNGTSWMRVTINPSTMKIIGTPGPTLDVTSEVSSSGTVGALEVNTVLTPSNNTGSGETSGDATGLIVQPTVNISQYSTGPVGTNAHKWVVGQRLRMPTLQGGFPTGKPQSYVGLLIAEPLSGAAEVEDALLEAWSLYNGTTLGSKFSGAVQIGNPGTTAQALTFGSGSGTRWNSMLWVTGKMSPFSYGTAATGDAYAAFIETKMSTYGSGSHPNIGGAYVATPEIESSGGATVTTYSTLRVGNAPTDGSTGFGSTARRALWVGTGQSEVEGSLAVGSLRITNSSAPSSSSDSSGSVGDVRWDSSYMYIKTGSSTWKRAALSTW